jgi:hypothetical protein
MDMFATLWSGNALDSNRPLRRRPVVSELGGSCCCWHVRRIANLRVSALNETGLGMKLRKIAVLAMLVTAAMGISSATSNADPVTPDVQYDAKIVDKDVVTTLQNGMFAISEDGKSVAVKDATGHDLVTLPLSYNLGDFEFPILQRVSADAKTLTMTAVTDVAQAVPRSALHNVATPLEEQQAYGQFSAKLGIAMAAGGLVGLTVGAVIGGIIGAIGLLGGPVALVTILTGITIGAGVGSVVGTIAAGGPTLIAAGIELINTLGAPNCSTRYAPKPCVP